MKKRRKLISFQNNKENVNMTMQKLEQHMIVFVTIVLHNNLTKQHQQTKQMKNSITWIIKLVAVAILLQTLFFKFSGAEESVYIFTKLGIEPFGRIGSGIVELIASILILIPRTTLLGALLALGTMAGAIVSHLFVLGIVVKDDGGQLFTLAIITFICSAILIWQNRNKIPDLLKFKI